MNLDKDTLQANEADDNSEDENLEGGELDENSESATENDDENSEENQEEQPEKVVFDDKQQAKVDEIVGGSVKRFREEERKNADLQRQLNEANAKIPVEPRPDVPEMPDPLDADFEQKMSKRDKAISDASAFDAREAEAKRTQEATQHQQAQVAQQELETTVSTFKGRADGLGIKPDVLSGAIASLNGQGMNAELGSHIMADEKGPAITVFLDQNPLVVDKMRTMTTAQAAAFIETDVKPALSSKKTTSAPTPATNVEGGGAPPGERGPKGATFE